MEHKTGRIPLEGLPNTRDLGGYVTKDKKVILPKRLIRSGALADMTANDQEVLFGDYRVRTVVDFRTAMEAKQSPEPKREGVDFLFCPILDEETAGFTHEDETSEDPLHGFLKHAESLNGNPQEYIDKLYLNLVSNEQAIKEYGTFLNALAEAKEGAVLWHCSAGKDRAGVGTAFVLSVLGVPRETILQDFIKTNHYLSDGTEKMVAKIKEINPEEKLAECAKLLCEVRESYLKGVFRLIDEQYGGIQPYLREVLGLTEESINKIKKRNLG